MRGYIGLRVGEGIPPPFYYRDVPRKDIVFNRVREKDPWNMTEAEAGKYSWQINAHERRVVALDARNRQIDKDNAKESYWQAREISRPSRKRAHR